jgi:hypothetical protein
MSIKIVNCDCRKGGAPHHTHSHYVGADGKVIEYSRTLLVRPAPSRWLPLFWSVVIIVLLVLLALVKYHAPELEAP